MLPSSISQSTASIRAAFAARPHLMSYFSAPSDGCNGVLYWAALYIEAQFSERPAIGVDWLTVGTFRDLEKCGSTAGQLFSWPR